MLRNNSGLESEIIWWLIDVQSISTLFQQSDGLNGRVNTRGKRFCCLLRHERSVSPGRVRGRHDQSQVHIEIWTRHTGESTE